MTVTHVIQIELMMPQAWKLALKKLTNIVWWNDNLINHDC